MADLTIHPAKSLQGPLALPGDKSISHRALLTGAIASGTTQIHALLKSQDVATTRLAVEALGVKVKAKGQALLVEGKGALKAPSAPLEMGNSGTTARLLLGILAGQSFSATLTGDDSLSKRPMRRVTEPLQQMGAKFKGQEHLPLTIQGGKLSGVRYALPVASAQVKSALLYAGLFAEGPTTVVEPVSTRDHTERILRSFGAELSRAGTEVTIQPKDKLQGRSLTVPSDFSSAAFFLVAASIVKGSSLTLPSVGLNPSRSGLLELLQRMGAAISAKVTAGQDWEPMGEIHVQTASLKGISIEPEEVPGVVDELPVLMVAATQAEGTTRIEGAGELRVKETDRIKSMVTGLSALGANIRAETDAVIIEGPTPLKGAQVDSLGDHRTAMALAVAGLVAQGATTIKQTQWIEISFPGFAQVLLSVVRS